jgi:3',5'-cyclic-AMP phosphodiesterase
VNLDRGNVVIHQCSFLYEGPAFSLHDTTAQQSQSLSELVETRA